MRLVDRSSPGASDRADAEESHPKAAAAVGRILVVDDEPLVRKTLVRRLVKLGHDAVGAEDGADAMAMLSQGATYDLVVTDMLMHPVGGRALAEWIAEHRPDLASRLVFMTGAADREDVRRFLESRYWLRKPVQAKQIQGIWDLVTG